MNARNENGTFGHIPVKVRKVYLTRNRGKNKGIIQKIEKTGVPENKWEQVPEKHRGIILMKGSREGMGKSITNNLPRQT